MNSKKLRLFLLAGFAFFAFLVIATFWNIISEYYRLQAEYPNDIEAQRNFGFGTCVFMLLAFPLWGAELSFIRSVYKILKHKPQGYVQICYTISACIAVFMLILFCLAMTGALTFVHKGGYNNTAEVMLLTGWIGFILSFILGSIPIKTE
jgi:hypothetical protein